MKNNKKNKILKQEKAVVFDDTISLNTNINKSVETIWETIYRGITLLFCIFSILYTLNKTISMSLNSTIVVYTVLFVVLFTLINNMKKYKIIANINLVLIMLFLAYRYRTFLFYGIQIVRSNFIDAINKYYFTNYETYFVSVPVMTDYYIAKTVIMVAISFILSLYFSILLKRKKSMILMLILFSILFYMAVNFSVKPNITAILLIMFTFISVYSLESKPNIMLRTNNGFKQKSHKNKRVYFYSFNSMNSSIINKNWIISILTVLLIIIIMIIIVPKSSYKKNKLVDEISKDQLGFVENIWDKIIIELPYEQEVQELLESEQSGVGNGDLKSIDRKGFSNETHLKVKMENGTPLLLKGYVGSVYEGNRFSDLDKSIYNENKEIFKNLERYNIYPHTIGSSYLSSYNNSTLLYDKITIENIKANQNYAYVPYGLRNDTRNEKIFINDTIVDGKKIGEFKYDFNYYSQLADYFKNNNNQYSTYIDANYNNHKNEIEEYTDFVYKYYLDVPTKDLKKLEKDFKPIKKVEHPNSITQEIAKVKDYLYNHAVYDLSPGKKPNNKDYIEYFLYENHKGYCCHFATAATMMFRLMGIPSRYVEGYTVTLNDIKNNKNIDNSINIMDSNAHAWTEVYLPVYGWVPVDVTPGFSGLNIAAPQSNVTVPDEIKSSSEVSSETPSLSSSQIESFPSEISQNDSRDIINENETKEDNITITNISCLFFISVFLGVILMIFLFMVLKNIIVTSKRRESFAQKELNKSAISVYAYLEKILLFIGYKKNDSETEIEFAERVSQDCDYIYEDSFINATKLVLKAKFSKHDISEAELKEIITLSNSLNYKVFHNLKITKKFKYIMINNLK